MDTYPDWFFTDERCKIVAKAYHIMIKSFEQQEKQMKLVAGVELRENYGSVPKEIHLKVVDIGFDWVLVRHKGRNIYVPTSYTKD